MQSTTTWETCRFCGKMIEVRVEYDAPDIMFTHADVQCWECYRKAIGDTGDELRKIQ